MSSGFRLNPATQFLTTGLNAAASTNYLYWGTVDLAAGSTTDTATCTEELRDGSSTVISASTEVVTLPANSGDTTLSLNGGGTEGTAGNINIFCTSTGGFASVLTGETSAITTGTLTRTVT